MLPSLGNGLATIANIINVVRANWKEFVHLPQINLEKIELQTSSQKLNKNAQNCIKKPVQALASRWLTHMVAASWLNKNYTQVLLGLSRIQIELEKKGVHIHDSISALRSFNFRLMVGVWSGFYDLIFRQLFDYIQLNNGVQAPLMYNLLQKMLLLTQLIQNAPTVFFPVIIQAAFAAGVLPQTIGVISSIADTIQTNIKQRFENFLSGPLSLSRLNNRSNFREVYQTIVGMRKKRVKPVGWNIDDEFWSDNIQRELDKYMSSNSPLQNFQRLSNWWIQKFAKFQIHSIHIERCFARMRKLKSTKFNASMDLISAKLRATYNSEELILALGNKFCKRKKQQCTTAIVDSERVEATVYAEHVDDFRVEESNSTALEVGPLLSAKDFEALLAKTKEFVFTETHASLCKLMNQMLQYTSIAFVELFKSVCTQHTEIAVRSLILSLVFENRNLHCGSFEENFQRVGRELMVQ